MPVNSSPSDMYADTTPDLKFQEAERKKLEEEERAMAEREAEKERLLKQMREMEVGLLLLWHWWRCWSSQQVVRISSSP